MIHLTQLIANGDTSFIIMHFTKYTDITVAYIQTPQSNYIWPIIFRFQISDLNFWAIICRIGGSNPGSSCLHVGISLIFKGGYPWRQIGEGHIFLILIQGRVMQLYLSPMEGHTIFSPLNLRGVSRLVD